MTIGWGGVSRVDLEPAGCARPRVRRRPRLHRRPGLRRLLAAGLGRRRRQGRRRRAARPSPSRSRPAPSADVTGGCPGRPTRRCRRRRPTRRRARRWPTSSPPSPRRSAAAGRAPRPAWCCPRRRRTSCSSSTGSARELLDALRPRGAVPLVAAASTPRRGTAGVPSTTATSLTSLGTGLTAGRARPGRLHLAGARAPTACSTPCAGTRTSTRWSGSRTRPPSPGSRPPGSHVTVVNKREFAGTGLTVAAAARRDVRRRRPGRRADRGRGRGLAPRAVADLPLRRRPRLDRPPVRRRLAAQWLPAARDDRRRGRAAARGAAASTSGCSWWPTTAWSTAPDESRIDVDEHPELRDGVALLGGEARFRHLYCRRGAVDDVVADLARASSATGPTVLTRDEAIERGWFGAVDPRCPAPARRRRGRAAADDLAALIVSSTTSPTRSTLVGLHGSLTAATRCSSRCWSTEPGSTWRRLRRQASNGGSGSATIEIAPGRGRRSSGGGGAGGTAPRRRPRPAAASRVLDVADHDRPRPR